MANIRDSILSKYNIDIDQDNIFKLYKIDTVDITNQELENKIVETRKRWNTSVNGANEKNAERDRLRLQKAENFENILRDVALRKEVFNYINGPEEKKNNKDSDKTEKNTQFAKEYFKLISTTKRVNKSDVEFFFKYYQNERKNRKAILEMLNKELNISGIGKEESYSDNENDEIIGDKKKGKSAIITNLFQEQTVLKIQRAVEKYNESVKDSEVCGRFPKLQEGMYTFLDIDSVVDSDQFTNAMSLRAKEVYAIRQEKGVAYVPLVDFFNILQGIGDNKDVVDNITEFKLLLKYPNLTSYMYSFVDMKTSTMKGVIDVANAEYSFRDDADFIMNYYVPVHDNFGISDGAISGIIRKAKKEAARNKVIDKIDNKLGLKKKNIPIWALLIHYLVYFPILLCYLVFEITKAIITELHRAAIPVFVTIFIGCNWLFPLIFDIDNLIVLKRIFIKEKWLSYISEYSGKQVNGVFSIIVLSLILILFLLVVYILPALFVTVFITSFSEDFNKKFDWIGIERTFQRVFEIAYKKTERQYVEDRKGFIKKQTPLIICNFIMTIIVLLLIYFIPKGINWLGVLTGYWGK